MQHTLREWRRMKEITQEQLAEVCHVHVNTYRAWEENPADIKLSAAVKIVQYMGITLDDLLF